MHLKYISKSNFLKHHSIPILLNKSKSRHLRYVSYSIPLMCSLALLLSSCSLIFINHPSVSALDDSGEDATLQFAPGSLATATLSIDNRADANLSEQALATPGEVAYSSEHTITVSADNIDSYNLILTGTPSIGTNITGANGKLGNNLPENSWGYGFGNTDIDKSNLNYYSPTTSGQKLNTNTGDMAVVSNSVNFSRKLVFAAHFASTAESGHYRGSASLALTATPRTVGTWSTGEVSGITTMQEMTPDICAQVSTPAALEINVPTMLLHDTRDNNIYTIAKLADGNCWMTENLRLTGDKTLTSDSSDVTSDFIFPESLTELTSTDFAPSSTSISTAVSYYNPKTIGEYGVYYNWFSATAGTGTTKLQPGEEAASSICPAGWNLPSRDQYQSLLDSTEITNDVAGGSKLHSKPYNIAWSGIITDGKLSGAGKYTDILTRTAAIDNYSTSILRLYLFTIADNTVRADDHVYAGRGRTMRCITKNSSAYSATDMTPSSQNHQRD